MLIVRRILLLSSRAWKVQLSDSIISGRFEALACYGRSLYVGLPIAVFLHLARLTFPV
jgi:hypothetical protein